MVHDPEPDPDVPDPGPSDFWEDDEDPDLLNSGDFDPYDDLDEAEQDLIDEMREAAEREWLIPQTWLDDGGDGARDQPDG